jgi:hypothetical protein
MRVAEERDGEQLERPMSSSAYRELMMMMMMMTKSLVLPRLQAMKLIESRGKAKTYE